MKKSGRSCGREYGWRHVQDELADGVHPGVVAARMGITEVYILEVADQQGWPVSHRDQTSGQILDAFERTIP